MTIEFDCGTVKNSVGIPKMAVRAHMNECTNKECKENCAKELEKMGDVSFNAN